MSLPDKFHIAFQNDIAAYTLVSSVSAETQYPLSNMQSSVSSKPTVIDMTGETSVEFTFSSATQRTANCFDLHRHNFPTGTVAQLILYPDEEQSGVPEYDSTETQIEHAIPFDSIILGLDPLEGSFESLDHLTPNFSFWFDSVVYKSGKIIISNTYGFTNNQFILDKIYLALAYCPVDGPEWGIDSTGIEESEHKRKPGGGIETIQREVRRSISMEFKDTQNAERHVLRGILGRAKMGGDLLITLDPNDAMSWHYETTSIYRRTTPNSIKGMVFNSNDFAFAGEES